MRLTPQQLESFQIDFGLVYKNYGEADQEKLGPTKGGGKFNATANGHYIEFDGSTGLEKGTYIIDELLVELETTMKNLSQDALALALPHATYADDVISVGRANIGLVPTTAYLKNITMFAKLTAGTFKKITIFNPMNKNGLAFSAAPKGEGEYVVKFEGHLDATLETDADFLYKIEDVSSIVDDTSDPTVVTVPADADTAVVVTADLTATFNELINEKDVKASNFVLIKASDGSIVTGSLSYSSTTKIATFNPTASLTASTDYIWTISNVRDLAGNTLATTVVNFTTA